MPFVTKNHFAPVTFTHFDKKIAKHCFTTRYGGVSKDCFESLNMGYNRGDDNANVVHNFGVVCNALGLDVNRLAYTSQVHGKDIRTVTQDDFPDPTQINGGYKIHHCDAIITATPGITLVSFYADCVPLFFLDPVRRVAALAHAGWRGTLFEIGALTVRRMISDFACAPANILAGIGPSIGKCCYEIRSDVAFGFYNTGKFNEFIHDKKDGKYMIDLWGINKRILTELIPPQNIQTSETCTYCTDGFFSHRLMGERRGCMASFISLT
jgi:hypothetical protein